MSDEYPPVRREVDLRLRIKNSKDLRVLNVGAGDPFDPGLHSQLRFFEFKSLVHLDIYEPSVRKCTRADWGAGEVSFIVGDIRAFDLSAYDLVLMFDVVEHLPKKDALDILGRVGRALIFIPIESKPMKKNSENPYQQHLSVWTEDEFKALGFKTEVLKHYHGGFDAMWAEK